ncbi:MAG TPA: hypothetical protein VN372_14510 [Methanospirillum sp.]|nr:hypothetical protein [Methanospirillum sp.]
MSLLDNIKGMRSSDDGDGGGSKFNPFRLLEIGETMIRYADGIRIKDFVFLGVITSNRLILIDSAKQSTGVISKEIPVSLIKEAVLEQDERGRPTLAVTMEVGGQNRVMRLVFTGLIDEPVTECREWFSAINGYPPEPESAPEPHDGETTGKADQNQSAIDESQNLSVPTPEQESQPVPEQKPKTVITSHETDQEPKIRTIPDPAPRMPIQNNQGGKVEVSSKKVKKAPVSTPLVSIRREAPVTPTPEGSIRILIEKPNISPIQIRKGPARSNQGSGTHTFGFCIHCGARLPSTARFCNTCGKAQT